MPKECLDWQGNKWTPDSKEKAAHPNSRFTAPMANNPVLAPEANDPNGVPISAIIFGGRRGDTMPLVFQAFNWVHGVYIGATMGSEMTAAAVGGAGQVRRDPMAMLPFCGYHMGDYFRHWINMHRLIKHPPRIFHVNWFRKNAKGRVPVAGLRREHAGAEMDRGSLPRPDRRRGNARWVGYPRAKSFDLKGLHGNDARRSSTQLQSINHEEWRREVILQEELFMKLYSHLPKELIFQRELLVARL